MTLVGQGNEGEVREFPRPRSKEPTPLRTKRRPELLS